MTNSYDRGTHKGISVEHRTAFYNCVVQRLIGWPGKVLFVVVFCLVMGWLTAPEQTVDERPQYDGITFFERQHDLDGNVMDLYVVDASIDRYELMNFCSRLKTSAPVSRTFLVGFFHSGHNPAFPETAVLTGGYSFDQIETVSGLFSLYTYRKANGFSQLSHASESIFKEHCEELTIP